MELSQEFAVFISAAIGLIAALVVAIGFIVKERMRVWAEARLAELYESAPDYVDEIIKKAAEIAVTVVESMNLEQTSHEKLMEAERIAEAWLKEVFNYDIELERLREAIEYVLFEKKIKDPESWGYL